MRIIFCGGGTAGHITPAIAIAEHILKEDKNAELLFIGREGGEENRAIEKCGFRLLAVKIQGFKRKLSLENIKILRTALKARKKAKSIIKEFSPDVVIGTGGYVSWPVLRAAQGLGIPTAIHESNACPGLVTKLLAPKCDVVLLNLDGSEHEFKRKDNIKIVGNPVKEEFLTLDKISAKRKLGISQKEILISSFGGSGGSEKINEAIAELMRSHSSKYRNIRHIHSCGNKYYKALKESYPDLFKNKNNGCIIKPYIDDMPTVITASDIIISRCGAMTLAEISAAGIASILIPSPNVTNNHQYKNARLICDGGGAIMITEADLSPRALLDAVRLLETDVNLRTSMAEKMKKYHVKNSKDIIVSEIKKIAKK